MNEIITSTKKTKSNKKSFLWLLKNKLKALIIKNTIIRTDSIMRAVLFIAPISLLPPRVAAKIDNIGDKNPIIPNMKTKIELKLSEKPFENMIICWTT